MTEPYVTTLGSKMEVSDANFFVTNEAATSVGRLTFLVANEAAIAISPDGTVTIDWPLVEQYATQPERGIAWAACRAVLAARDGTAVAKNP